LVVGGDEEADRPLLGDFVLNLPRPY
jgi:hypothetical protein